MKGENILAGIIGILIMIGGLLIWYVDYAIFVSLGVVGQWIATITGGGDLVALGLSVLLWLLFSAIMVAIAIAGLFVIVIGLVFIVGD